MYLKCSLVFLSLDIIATNCVSGEMSLLICQQWRFYGANPAVETSTLSTGRALDPSAGKDHQQKNNLSSLDVFSGVKVHGQNVLTAWDLAGNLTALPRHPSWTK